MQLIYLKLDEQLQRLREAESRCTRVVRSTLDERFVASWIYHDLSVEGSPLRYDELQHALAGGRGKTWREDQLLQKVRLVRRAILFARDQAHTRRSFDLNIAKDFHRFLRADDDESGGRYRKEPNDSSAYRHDLASPKAISYRLRRLVSAFEGDQAAQLGHPIATACFIHRELIEIFPFATDSGIVARLAMNFWIMRSGYPPAVIHVADRQRYFDSYLSANGDFRSLVVESMLHGMDAFIRGLNEPTLPNLSGASNPVAGPGAAVGRTPAEAVA